MYRNILVKEIKEYKWTALIFTLILLLFAWTIVYAYKLNYAVLMRSKITFERYIWSQWFGQSICQALIVGAVIMGSASIGREAAFGTLGFIATKPVSRKKLLLCKVSSGIIIIELLITVSTAFLMVYSKISGIVTRDCSVYPRGVLALTLIVIPVYLLSVLFSVLFLNSLKAGTLAAAVILPLYGPAWYGVKQCPVYILISDSINYRVNTVCAVGMAACGLVFCIASLFAFERKEI